MSLPEYLSVAAMGIDDYSSYSLNFWHGPSIALHKTVQQLKLISSKEWRTQQLHSEA